MVLKFSTARPYVMHSIFIFDARGVDKHYNVQVRELDHI